MEQVVTAMEEPEVEVRSLRDVRKRLTWTERFNIALVRMTMTIRPIDALVTVCHRVIGAVWVHYGSRHLQVVVGRDRLPDLKTTKSLILVSNHRSFFDLFVIASILYRSGFRSRLFFPVRSNFFYDHPLGTLVIGLVSLFSMYPPIFRDRRRWALNQAAFAELSDVLSKGGSVGLHPEGTRKKDDDPYTFLRAKKGVGRAIHGSSSPVVPIFINGLGNHIVRQVWNNFRKRGEAIVVCFGAPIDFGDLKQAPAHPRTYQAISDRTMEVIGGLAEEEKEIRRAQTPK